MASTSWGEEEHSHFPEVTITLDRPYYGVVHATNIVGTPHMMGMTMKVTFDSDTGARIAMPEILRQLGDAGAIRGEFQDPYTGASIY